MINNRRIKTSIQAMRHWQDNHFVIVNTHLVRFNARSSRDNACNPLLCHTKSSPWHSPLTTHLRHNSNVARGSWLVSLLRVVAVAGRKITLCPSCQVGKQSSGSCYYFIVVMYILYASSITTAATTTIATTIIMWYLLLLPSYCYSLLSLFTATFILLLPPTPTPPPSFCCGCYCCPYCCFCYCCCCCCHHCCMSKMV